MLVSLTCLSQPQRELLDSNWNYTHSPEAARYYRIITKKADFTPSGLVMLFYGQDSVRIKGKLQGSEYEGEVSYYYPNGQLQAKGALKEGHRTGFWEEWYQNGQLREKGQYSQKKNKDNFLNTPRTEYVIDSFWDSTGKQLITNGTGSYISTSEGKHIREEGQYEQGKKSGLWKGYFEDGKLFYEENFADGILTAGTSFNRSGEKFTYSEETKEKMPEFTGGLQALQRHLQRNLKYPADARMTKRQGSVFVRFIIEESGEISNISLFTRGPGSSLEDEAIRVVRIMPAWVPGKQHGQPVKVEYVLPVRFVMM